MPWAKFIKAHLGAIVGMDFLTVEVATLFGLVRYYVLFVIDIGSRAVEIAGMGETRTVDGCSRWLVTLSTLRTGSCLASGMCCWIVTRCTRKRSEES
jgi:hypothetical protein